MKSCQRGKFFGRQHFNAWLAQRRPEISSAFRLSHRRLYIVPTGAGLLFVLVLILILVGAANYGSSMAFVLVFLLVGVAINAIWLTHSNLSGLEIEPGVTGPVFVGERAVFRLRLKNFQARRRSALSCGWYDEAEPQANFQLKAVSDLNISLAEFAGQRGWLSPSPIRLGSSWPLGLFYVWTVFRLSQKVLVYPQPAPPGTPLPLRAAVEDEKSIQNGSALTYGNDDFAGLRPYRIGDSPGRLDWRALARGGELQAREFQGNIAERLILDWWQMSEAGVEARLSRLCRWVLEAEAASFEYGLRLPGLEIAPGRGAQHRHKVLQAQALFSD